MMKKSNEKFLEVLSLEIEKVCENTAEKPDHLLKNTCERALNEGKVTNKTPVCKWFKRFIKKKKKEMHDGKEKGDKRQQNIYI